MEDIIEPTIDYDFSKLYLGPPTTLAGGAYFTRLMYNTNKSLFIQTPKSLTKQGFIKSGKKVYADLMFDNNDTVFINWIENLESKCQDMIYTKGQNWFETKLEKDDIESAFTSPFKIFKSGKYYLLRVNVKQNIKIYDEKDQIIKSEDITNDKTIISILEIQGIKFTSRNFQIEIELKQSMVVSPDPFLDECFIKKPSRKQPIKDEEARNETIDGFDKLENVNSLIEQSAKDLEKNMQINSLIKNNNSSSSNTILNSNDNNNNNNTAKTNCISDSNTVSNTDSIDLEMSFDSLTNNENDEKKDAKNDAMNDSINDAKNDNENSLFELEEANITLDIEEFEPECIDETFEDPNVLKEVDFSSTLENNLESITLKKPNQVYHEIYQKAKRQKKPPF
jgi:hypothetical protein